MCNCINVKIGSYGNQIMVDRPKCMVGRAGGSSNPDKLCLDKCIAEEVQYLWSLDIRTTGCCCGHNKQVGYIGVIGEDIEFMEKLRYKVLDDRGNFVPKSHNVRGRVEYYRYGN